MPAIQRPVLRQAICIIVHHIVRDEFQINTHLSSFFQRYGKRVPGSLQRRIWYPLLVLQGWFLQINNSCHTIRFSNKYTSTFVDSHCQQSYQHCKQPNYGDCQLYTKLSTLSTREGYICSINYNKLSIKVIVIQLQVFIAETEKLQYNNLTGNNTS